MKIFNKYLYNQLLYSFVIGFIVFTFVLTLNSLPQLMDLFLNKNASIFTILKLIFYLILSLLSITFPISMLFSVLFTYSRLSESREIIALGSAGIPTVKFVYQPILMAIIASIILIWLNLSIIPRVQTSFHNIYSQIAQKQTSIKFEENTFTKIGDYRIYINEIDKKKDILRGIKIYRLGQERLIIIASYGKTKIDPQEGLIFTLNEGILQKGIEDDIYKLTHFSFKNYQITIPLESKYKGPVFQTLRELSGKELIEEIARYRNQGIPSHIVETEYYLRWAISFSVLVLVFLGLPVGILTHKGSRTIVFGISLVIIGIYYFMLIGSITISEKGTRLPAQYVMWLPNIITFSIGSVFMHKLLKK